MNATATATASDFAPQKGKSYLLSVSPDFFDPDDEQKAKEVWEAERASAHTSLTVRARRRRHRAHAKRVR